MIFYRLRRAIPVIILHILLLNFTWKRSLIFLYHRPEMLRGITCGKIFNCLFWLHVSASRFVLRIKKPCDFGCLYRLVLRTDFNPDYLILADFIWKIVPQQNPRRNLSFLAISAPVAVVAIFLATLWQATVILLSDTRERNAYPRSSPRHRERIFGQTLHARQRLSLRRKAWPYIKPILL